MGSSSSKTEAASGESETTTEVEPFEAGDEEEGTKEKAPVTENEEGDEKKGAKDEGPQKEEDDEEREKRASTMTPVMGRPRPPLPVKRLPLDDPDRPDRVLPFSPTPLPPFGDEVFEEAKMICDFSRTEIEGLYRRFTKFDDSNYGWITGEEFSMQPEFDTNPLRDLIMVALEIKDDDWLDFNKFIEKMSVFNVYGPQEEKMKFIYKMTDVNHDGFLDKGDFECFLMLICGNELEEDDIVTIMEKTFEHVDTDEDGVIDYDEFTKIVGRTDVVSKVSIVTF